MISLLDEENFLRNWRGRQISPVTYEIIIMENERNVTPKEKVIYENLREQSKENRN